MQWFGPRPTKTVLEWKWRGCIYYLSYHREALPFFWPFTMAYSITEEELVRRAQPEIEARIAAKREAATKFLRARHGIPERRP